MLLYEYLQYLVLNWGYDHLSLAKAIRRTRYHKESNDKLYPTSTATRSLSHRRKFQTMIVHSRGGNLMNLV